MKRAFVFLTILVWGTFAQAQQIIPFAFQGQRVTSVTLSNNRIDYSKMLVAAVEDSGIYSFLTDMDCSWQPLGLTNRPVEKVYVQMRGTGPLDYFRVYASIFPECYTNKSNPAEPELIFYRDLLDSCDWVRADSGITPPCIEYLTDMDGFDFGGQEPPRPVFASSHTKLFRFDDSLWTAIAPDSDIILSPQFVKTSSATNQIFFGGSNASMSPFLYCSYDNGQSWTEIRDSVIRNSGDNTCYDLAIASQFPSNMYLAMNGRVLASHDSGQTWQETGLNGYDAPVRGVGEYNLDYIFAWLQTDTATIYESNDAGDTWYRLHNPNRQFTINDIAYGTTAGMFQVYFATNTGLYVLPHLWDAISSQPPALPLRFSLLQNTPNPFNPSTFIRYRLNAQLSVRLAVYNILGQKVTELVNGNQLPGLHSVPWNGRDNTGRLLPSGVYYYRLSTANGESQTRKMILLK